MTWDSFWNALGSAARNVGNYLANISWGDALRGLANLPWNLILGGLGTGAAIGSTIYGHQQQMRDWRKQARAARERAEQLAALGRRPLDIGQYYTPISEAEKAALLRGLKSNVAERGIQPGGYYDALVAELLAKTETERWREAARLAAQSRELELRSLLGSPLPPARPPFPVIGDFGALGRAIEYDRMRKAAEAAAARRAAFENRILGLLGGGAADVRNLPDAWQPYRAGERTAAPAAAPLPAEPNPSTTWGYGGNRFVSPWGPYEPATPAPSQYLPAYARSLSQSLSPTPLGPSEDELGDIYGTLGY